MMRKENHRDNRNDQKRENDRDFGDDEERER